MDHRMLSQHARSSNRCLAPFMVAVAFIFLSSVSRSATLTTLAKFSYSTGISPSAGVTLDAAGNLYGTTSDGGVLGDRGSIGEGGIFRVEVESNELRALAWFNGWTGLSPSANLVPYSDGNLYGTAIMDGGNGNGTIFRFNPNTNTITPLVAFDGTNGSAPSTGLVVGTDGAFYGTTGLGGAAGKGTLFRFDVHTNQHTTLISFNGQNGSYPGQLLLDANGDLYGTTNRGGATNKGTVFKFSTSSNTLSTLATFTGQNGERPDGALTLDSSGNLFGTTILGGLYGEGTVYRLSAVTNTLLNLVSFDGPNGAWPHAGVIMDAHGNLYGTTSWGGIDYASSEGGMGTVFRWDSATQILTTLVFFDGFEGKHPLFGELAVDAAGNLYGTTYGGGGGLGFGTVFKVSNTGFAVPEPTSFFLVSIAGTVATFRRRGL
jgi:uncharacterized repeat protein (TIGR03803 family)